MGLFIRARVVAHAFKSANPEGGQLGFFYHVRKRSHSSPEGACSGKIIKVALYKAIFMIGGIENAA